MQRFAELGALVEQGWRSVNYDERAFPEIAATALAEKRLTDHISAWDVVRWVHSTVSLPAQMDLELGFGDPPITLFVGPRFYIDVYFWLDGTTTIHQHSFSGAFQVLLGSSVHAKYSFEKAHEINPHFLIGKISLTEVKLLKKGDIRPIVAGPEYIHSLFHLDRPSATITVRTYSAANAPVQYSYLKPFVARNPFFTDPLLKRKVQTVNLLLRTKHPDTDRFIRDIIDTSDFQTIFYVLKSAFDFLCHREMEEMLEVTRSKDRFLVLLQHAQGKHGELTELWLPVFEEEWRQNDIAKRRGQVTAEDHRFFMALLLNVPDRANILRLISERFQGRDAVELVIEWVRKLAATRIFGSREPSVLGIGEFTDEHLFVLRGLLRGLTIDKLRTTALESNVHGDIGAIVNHVKGLPLFQPLFAP
jgi:hypothetical protein